MTEQRADVHHTPDGTPVHGRMIPLGVMAPDTCPPGLRDMGGAVISEGRIVTWGSVARHFIEKQIDRQRAIDHDSGHVYFIQAAHGGPVKIGRARCVNTRIASLQTAHPYPLQLLAVLPNAGRNVEQRLHERFADRRLNGEWFDITQTEVEEAVNDTRNA